MGGDQISTPTYFLFSLFFDLLSTPLRQPHGRVEEGVEVGSFSPKPWYFSRKGGVRVSNLLGWISTDTLNFPDTDWSTSPLWQRTSVRWRDPLVHTRLKEYVYYTPVYPGTLSLDRPLIGPRTVPPGGLSGSLESTFLHLHIFTRRSTGLHGRVQNSLIGLFLVSPVPTDRGVTSRLGRRLLTSAQQRTGVRF